MNRGTAQKLIECLESRRYHPGYGQLRGNLPDGNTCYCVLGVLADFLDPQAWIEHALHGWSWKGEVFFLPEDAMKRCKMKTRDLSFITENGVRSSLVDTSFTSDWKYSIYHLKNNYEQM